MHRRARSAAVIIAAITAIVGIAACSSGDDETPAAAPSGSSSPVTPSTSESPSPQPVRGRVTTKLMSVSNEPVVFAGQAPPTDGRYVRDLVRKSKAWLDLHLTDLQDGGAGKVGLVAAEGLVNEASTVAKLAITRGLVPDGAVVATARYEMLVGVDQTADWVRATVTVTTEDGYQGSAQFVFTPAGERPTLIAAGPTDPDFEPRPAPAPSATASPTPTDDATRTDTDGEEGA